MNHLLEEYLAFLQEREWTDPSDPGTVHHHFLDKVLGKLTGSGDLAQFRQDHQPSMVNVYVKRSLGDYRGRANMLNTYRFKKAGIEDWEDAKKILQKAIDHEKNIHPGKFLKGIKTVQDIAKEPLGKEAGWKGSTSSDDYADGISSGPMAMGGDGGGDGGGGE